MFSYSFLDPTDMAMKKQRFPYAQYIYYDIFDEGKIFHLVSLVWKMKIVILFCLRKMDIVRHLVSMIEVQMFLPAAWTIYAFLVSQCQINHLCFLNYFIVKSIIYDFLTTSLPNQLCINFDLFHCQINYLLFLNHFIAKSVIQLFWFISLPNQLFMIS